MKKKLLFAGGIAAIIVVMIVAIAINTKPDEGITRYEWVRMLTERFEITGYQAETPYFKDVVPESEYFAFVQAAYEWGIIDNKSSFKGDKVADGKFITLTAMKAIGKYKIRIYLGMAKEPDDKDYLDLALQEGLITKKQLRSGISIEESAAVLDKAEEMYLSTLWRDDYVEYTYQDGVKELQEGTVLSVNEDVSEMTAEGETVQSLSTGEIIIFTHPVTGEKLAKEITAIGDDGTLKLADASLDRIFETLMLSDITSVTADDIMRGRHDNIGQSVIQTSSPESEYTAMPVFNIEKAAHNKGFSVSVKADEEGITVTSHNNDTSEEATISINDTLGEGNSISATLDISRIDIGLEAYGSLDGLEYLNVQVESDINCKSEIKLTREKKIPLFEGMIPIAGIAQAKIQFSIVFSVDGTISLEADIPAQFAADYVKEAGVRVNAAAEMNPLITANCTTEVKINIAPGIAILGYDVLGLEANVGVQADAQVITRRNSNIRYCADLSVAAPIVSAKVNLHESIEAVIEHMEWNSALEWDIITKENAPFHKAIHYEEYKNGTGALVDKCTYGKKKAGSAIVPFDVYAIFDTEFTDEGDYYSVTGRLCRGEYIPKSMLEVLQPGDTYDFYGHVFRYEGKSSAEEMREKHRVYLFDEITEVCLFSDENGTTYYTSSATSTDPNGTIAEGGPGYHIYWYDDDIRQGTYSGISVALIDEAYEFRIEKDAEIAMLINSDRAEFTAEQCYEEAIADDNGRMIANGIDIPVSIGIGCMTMDGYVRNIDNMSQPYDFLYDNWVKYKIDLDLASYKETDP